jgi:transcriptional regulator GlxA family with amidase domain
MLLKTPWFTTKRIAAVLLLSLLWLSAHEAIAQSALSQVSTGASRGTRTVGVLLFPGFEALDAYGPMELWGGLGKRVEIVTIAKRPGPVASAQGPQSVARFGYRDAPQLDLLVVPGGPGGPKAFADNATLDFVRARAARAEVTMSVCNGASILAAAGLLDGRKATTNKEYWQVITQRRPAVKWIASARWVDDGDIVTSSGVSAGMDMTLHVIARLYGLAAAESVASSTEYEWHRDATRDPFAAARGLTAR